MDRTARSRWSTVMAAAAVGCALQCVAGIAAAATPQMTYPGNAIMSGGVGEDERETMRQEAARFNLWLMFVEQGTGNYSAAVKVTVTDENARPVIDVVADGPWLFARVPPGHYRVRTANGGEQPVTVGANGRTVAVLRLPADVAPSR